MKSALSCFVGVSASLLLTGSAPAAFVGLTAESVPNEFGLLAVRVYAEFSSPHDRLLGAYGMPLAPLHVEVEGGVFFQSQFGSDAPPHEALVEVIPTLAFDTFVTIGLATSPGNDQMFTTPGWPGSKAPTANCSCKSPRSR